MLFTRKNLYSTLLKTWLPLGLDGQLPPDLGAGKLPELAICMPQYEHWNFAKACKMKCNNFLLVTKVKMC